MIPYTYIYIF